MLVLGIESSCDETAAAVVTDAARPDQRILANVVLSQLAEHAPYGGVVPEIAARAHVEKLDGLIRLAMAEAKVDFADLDGVAATAGPGLIGGGRGHQVGAGLESVVDDQSRRGQGRGRGRGQRQRVGATG